MTAPLKMVEPLGVDGKGLFIGGEWIEGAGSPLVTENPVTGEALLTIGSANDQQIGQAFAAARKVQPRWSRLSPIDRARRLQRFADLVDERSENLAALLALEVGKPINQGRGELGFASGTLRYQAEWARRLLGEIVPSDTPGETIHLTRVPVGVVVAICAWNFPMAMYARKVAPALLAGNAVVLKSSETTPLSAIAMTRLAQEADFPPGVLNLITGDRTVGELLVADERADMVTMTGSVASGKAVMANAATHLAKISLELGGKAPAIVWADADLEVTVPALVTARHLNSGQVCTSAERIYVHERIVDDFLSAYSAAVLALRVGDPFSDVDMGPLVSKAQQEKVASAVDEALQGGAKEVVSTELSDVAPGGFWSAPTVLTGAPASCRLMREETFGPVSPVVPVATLDEALVEANSSRYGLSSYVYSNDYNVIMRVAAEIGCGELYVNRTLGEAIQGHHSGHKQSGVGGEDGLHGLLRYTAIRAVYHNWLPEPERPE